MQSSNPIIPSGLLTVKGGLAAVGGALAGVFVAKKIVEPADIVQAGSGKPLPSGDEDPAPTPGTHKLSGIYDEGATLGASQPTLGFVRYPVAFTREPPDAALLQAVPSAAQSILLSMRDDQGDILPVSGVVVDQAGAWMLQIEGEAQGRTGDSGGDTVLSRVVTNLTAEVVSTAFDLAQWRVANKNDLYDGPSGTTDELVNLVLRNVAPGETWPTTHQNLEATDPLALVWEGISLVAALAYQTQFNITYGGQG